VVSFHAKGSVTMLGGRPGIQRKWGTGIKVGEKNVGKFHMKQVHRPKSGKEKHLETLPAENYWSNGVFQRIYGTFVRDLDHEGAAKKKNTKKKNVGLLATRGS